MDIAILGGTGDIGEGLALRWAQDTDHTITIGSRKDTKAKEKVKTYRSILAKHGVDARMAGVDNETAAMRGEVVVVGIPPEYATSTVESLAPVLSGDDVLVSPVVRMSRDDTGFHYDSFDEDSLAEEIAAATPSDVPVVGAFQNLAAGALRDLSVELAHDVVVTGDDQASKKTIRDLTEEIHGLRALDGGPLANSREIESITPLLINLAMNNPGMHDLGVRFE